MKRCRLAEPLTVAICVLAAGQAQAQDGAPPLSLYGTPGLIDMPTAETSQDADLTTSLGGFANELRATLTFQATPWLSGSFRLVRLPQSTFSGDPRRSDDITSDRSFDVHLRLLSEGYLRPSVVLGFRDLAGTGKFSSEFIAATKHLTRSVAVTAGLGWGRLGSFNSLGAFGTRDEDFEGLGGVPSTEDWFRGDYAAFGGLSWDVTDALTFKLEYSSDAYDNAVAGGNLDRETPFNAGLEYRFDNGFGLALYALYGSEVGAQITYVGNPKRPQTLGGREEAPLPLTVRAEADIADTSWTEAPPTVHEDALRRAMARDGLVLEGLDLSARKATLRFLNPRFQAAPQALGRAARAMAQTLPASIEVFELVPVLGGLSLSTVTLRRSDLETFEFRAAEDLRPRVHVGDAFATARPVAEGRYPRFEWGLAPYVQVGLFDVERPVRADLGVRASASVRPTSNTLISGSVSARVVGNLDQTSNFDGGNLAPVRTDFPLYLSEGDPGIEQLQFARFGRPGRDFYSRVSVGYLESMFGGVSGEVLWKPVDSRLALGLELNHVWQRDFDRRFGFQDYDVTTGHLSAYYDFENGFHGQIDAGRYLARDIGATFTLNREFANGWIVGAFATLTDASAEDFGEGSFDKGIILRIPTSWVLGTADRSIIRADIRPILRNGGARLGVGGRLYPLVRDYHEPTIDETFGRFWR